MMLGHGLARRWHKPMPKLPEKLIYRQIRNGEGVKRVATSGEKYRWVRRYLGLASSNHSATEPPKTGANCGNGELYEYSASSVSGTTAATWGSTERVFFSCGGGGGMQAVEASRTADGRVEGV
jgi:hypothetical protein